MYLTPTARDVENLPHDIRSSIFLLAMNLIIFHISSLFFQLFMNAQMVCIFYVLLSDKMKTHGPINLVYALVFYFVCSQCACDAQ